MFRKFSRILVTAGVICMLLALPTAFASAQQATPQAASQVIRITQIDTSQFPQVTVYVSVTDASGEPVAVNPDELRVKESDQDITPGQIRGVGETGPLTTLLVIDVSGSMNSGGKLSAAKAAAHAYVEQARPVDQMGLLAFNTSVEYVQPLTSDHQLLAEAIDRLKAREDTAMYDALAKAVDILSTVSGRKAIIVLTDGLDNRSTVSSQEVVGLIGPQGLSISTVGLGEPTHSQSAITSLDEPALRALAEQAGGLYGFANDAEALRGLYEHYSRVLQSEYVIVYTSPATLRDGVNRTLSISLAGAAGTDRAAVAPLIYNPGGLVPEVAQPASWGLFLALIGGLLVLLFVPLLFRGILQRGRREKKGKIKLVSQEPRVKLKN